MAAVFYHPLPHQNMNLHEQGEKSLSRYTFVGQNPRYRIIVGWDAPLTSYFAQVEDLAFESNGAIIDPEALIWGYI